MSLQRICVLCTVAVELALGALSLNSRITSRGKWMAAKRGSGSSSGGGGGGSQHNSDEEDAEQSFESFIDSGEWDAFFTEKKYGSSRIICKEK